jgi:hypothetical protein
MSKTEIFTFLEYFTLPRCGILSVTEGGEICPGYSSQWTYNERVGEALGVTRDSGGPGQAGTFSPVYDSAAARSWTVDLVVFKS